MAIELGTGYVSIVPSGQGFSDQIRKQITDELPTAADDAGDKAGAGFMSRFGHRAGGMAQDIGKGLAIGVAGAFGIGAVLGKGAVDAASDLAETMSKANTIFGDGADEVSAWADTADTALGQSRQQALDSAATFGNLFSQLGLGSDVTADMSTSMVELASDFASFHNADVSDVLDAQTAAFRGEYDAVQKYVPTINAAAVEQKALAMGLADSKDQLDAQDKALATQALLMEGAGAAAGDFARTSGGLANQQRIAGAAVKNLQAEIGTALLPIVTKFVTFVTSTVVPAMKQAWPEVQAAIQDVIEWVKANVIPVVEAIVVWIRDNWPQISAVIGGVMAEVVTVIDDFVTVITTLWQNFGDNILRFLHAAWDPIAQIVEGFMLQIKGIIDVITGLIHGDWDQVWTGIKEIFVGIWTEMEGKARLAMAAVQLVISVPLELIQATWERVWGEVRDFFSGIWDAISGKASDIWSDITSTVEGGINDVIGFVTGLPGRVKDAVLHGFDAIWQGFEDALNSIIDLWNRLEIPEVKIGGQDPLGDFGPSLPSATIGGWDFPDIRHVSLARGGIATGPTAAVIGDNPGVRWDPEVVAPLSKLPTGTDPRMLAELRAIRGALSLPRVIREGNMTTEQFLIEQRRQAMLASSTWSRSA